jgi:selenocysteine-specific elongation factor
VHAPTDRLDVRLRLLAEEKRALRADAPVHLHLGAAHVTARVAALETDRIEPGASVLARLTLDRAIGALAGDRLVLRDASATHTIGGGVVIDPFPPRRGRRTPERLVRVAALEHAEPAEALRGLLQLPPGWTDRDSFFRSRNLLPAGQAAVLEAAPAVAVATHLMTADTLGALRKDVMNGLVAHHAAARDQPGLQFERLRVAMPDRPPADALRAIIETMFRSGDLEQDGPWLRLPSHRVKLSAQDERLWNRAHALIVADRFRPPRTRDLAQALSAPEAATRTLLKRLQRMGRIIEVAPDQFFMSETVAEMAAIAAELAATQPTSTLTAAVFRDRLATGRKVAIEVLEFFDRAGVTVRVGDVRQVRVERVGRFGPFPGAVGTTPPNEDGAG